MGIRTIEMELIIRYTRQVVELEMQYMEYEGHSKKKSKNKM